MTKRKQARVDEGDAEQGQDVTADTDTNVSLGETDDYEDQGPEQREAGPTPGIDGEAARADADSAGFGKGPGALDANVESGNNQPGTKDTEAAEVAVRDAKATVDEIRSQLAVAEEEHEQAIAVLNEKVQQNREPLDPTAVIKLDPGGAGQYIVVDAPKGWAKERRVLLGGVNYEHVDDDVDGVWCYRAMP